MSQRYWIIGGEYGSSKFEQILPGTEKIVGPFTSAQDARDEWRRMTMRESAHPLTRYAITAEARA